MGFFVHSPEMFVLRSLSLSFFCYNSSQFCQSFCLFAFCLVFRAFHLIFRIWFLFHLGSFFSSSIHLLAIRSYTDGCVSLLLEMLLFPSFVSLVCHQISYAATLKPHFEMFWAKPPRSVVFFFWFLIPNKRSDFFCSVCVHFIPNARIYCL